MRKMIKDFFLRGMIAAWGGPVILSLVYLFIYKSGEISSMDIPTMVKGNLTVTLLAFIASGITVIYNSERLPYAMKTIIHFAVLYLDYVIIYLCNDWIKASSRSMLIFSLIFIGCFILVWLSIYIPTRINMKKMNDKLKELNG